MNEPAIGSTALQMREEESGTQSRPEEVNQLVALAIREKVPVEVLERLVALQERVTMRNARAAFFDAVASFQEQCPTIHKSAKATIKTRSGGSYGYTFAPLDEITRTIRPVLKRHGLSYSWDVSAGEHGILNVVCILRHIEGHEERATFPVPSDTDAAMSSAQKNGAALTYGRRQSLVAVLGLTTSDDVDGAAGGDDGEPISAAQLVEINKLRDEVKADAARFCQFLGIDTLKDLPASRFDEARAALEQKRRRA